MGGCEQNICPVAGQYVTILTVCAFCFARLAAYLVSNGFAALNC